MKTVEESKSQLLITTNELQSKLEASVHPCVAEFTITFHIRNASPRRN